ncbi:MAG: YceI family protein [Acidimicrobiales bacterium]
MTVAKGTHNIGPRDGQLLINVWKDGVAAKMGHDLTLLCTRWNGTADINPENPAACSVSATIDLAGIEVLEGKGGAKSLSEGDKGDIKKNLHKALGSGQVSFQSTGISGSPSNLELQGQLTINGKSNPVNFTANASDDGQLSGKTSFKQTDFGIKPFSAMLGALKIKDAVDVSFNLRLPTA